MNREERLSAALYKFLVGAVAVLGLILFDLSFGDAVWRSFVFWALLMAAVYYIMAGFALLVAKKQLRKILLCPVIEGAIIVSLFTTGITAIINHASGAAAMQLEGFWAAVFYIALPILALGDWWIFVPKGKWRITDPLFWLAPATIYFSWVMLSAELGGITDWLYPQSWMDYNEVGFWSLVEYLMIYLILMLLGGYILILADSLLSGRIGEKILLPKVKRANKD